MVIRMLHTCFIENSVIYGNGCDRHSIIDVEKLLKTHVIKMVIRVKNMNTTYRTWKKIQDYWKINLIKYTKLTQKIDLCKY